MEKIVLGGTSEGVLVFNQDLDRLEIDNTYKANGITDENTYVVKRHGSLGLGCLYEVFTLNKPTMELDADMYGVWLNRHNMCCIKYIDEEDESYRLKDLAFKNRMLADRIRKLEKFIADDETEVIDYTTIRKAVIAGANERFRSNREVFASNQGIYKHIDGGTTTIDVDGFYDSEDSLTESKNISNALLIMASDIDKFADGIYYPIPGLNDKTYLVDRLLDISKKDISVLLDENIIPIKIRYSTNRDGNNIEGCKVIFIRPRYRTQDDLMLDLRKIYREAKELASLCLTKSVEE